MGWPAQSPELNIKLFWDELDIIVKVKQLMSAAHLWELLQQSWKELDL